MTGRGLVAVRRALAVVIGLRIALSPFRALAASPDAIFDPPAFLAWLAGVPDVEVIIALQLVGVVAAGLALAQRWPRASLAVAWLALLVLAGLRTSQGKVLHNDLLLLLATVPFLLGPAVTEGDRQRRCSDFAWPHWASMAVIAMAYFFAGWWKMRLSGIEWVTSDNVQNLMYTAAGGNRPPTDVVALFVGDHIWVGRSLAVITLFTELGAPALIAWRRTRLLFVVLAGGLHVGTWLALGLDYWTWLATDVIVLTTWWTWRRSAVAARLPRSDDGDGLDGAPQAAGDRQR